MLLALLFTNEDCLAAAAPACEQQPYGDRYWREFHPGKVAFTSDCQTSYVDVRNKALCERLLDMTYDDVFAGGEDAALALVAELRLRDSHSSIKRRAA